MQMIKRIYFITVCLILFTNNVISSAASLKEELTTLFKTQPSYVWSVSVENANSADKLFEITPHRTLIPASNEKIPICAAILLKLGPEYIYQTSLFHTGSIEGSTLYGNLIITGSGDPSIGGRFNNGDVTYQFRLWAELLKRKGIKSIQGDIIGVDDVFDDIPHGLNWNPIDLVEWYAAEISALSFNDGCIDILIKGSDASGKPAELSLNPPTKYIQLIPSVKTVKTRKSDKGVEIVRNPKETALQVKGTIRAKRSSTIYASVPNPTLFFATVLKETLQKEGVTVKGDPVDGDDILLKERNQWKKIDVYKSPPLKQLVEVCLRNSQNLYAEHFIKTLGYAEYGQGSWPMGVAAVKDILTEHGCKLDGVYFADGSGLSRENRLSANAIIAILQSVRKSPQSKLFFNSLPQAGVSGTLKQRMRDTAAYKRVFAKTGTLNGSRSLSGLINAKSGKTYLFSFLGNATSQTGHISEIIDEACALIASKG